MNPINRAIEWLNDEMLDEGDPRDVILVSVPPGAVVTIGVSCGPENTRCLHLRAADALEMVDGQWIRPCK